MDTTEMLNRLKSKDFNAYCQLTETYGWKLYSRIRDRVEDREKADAVYNETLSGFCKCLTDYEGDDAVESLLYAYAENVCSRMEQMPENPSENVPAAREAFGEPFPSKRKAKKQKSARKSGGFGFALCVLLLLLGILAALWIIFGLLMDMNFIPELDLGYSWFNMNIAPWF